LLTAAAKAGVLMMPIGAWMIGNFRRSRSVSAFAGHIVSSQCRLKEDITPFAAKMSEPDAPPQSAPVGPSAGAMGREVRVRQAAL
jgi:hypothetical protein